MNKNKHTRFYTFLKNYKEMVPGKKHVVSNWRTLLRGMNFYTCTQNRKVNYHHLQHSILKYTPQTILYFERLTKTLSIGMYMIKNKPTHTFLHVFELSQPKNSFFHFFFSKKNLVQIWRFSRCLSIEKSTLCPHSEPTMRS